MQREKETGILRLMMPNLFIFLMHLTPFVFSSSTALFFPDLGAGALYFSAISYPERISLWIIFLSGLFQDSLLGAPLGTFGGLNLLLWFITLAHGKYLFKKSFLTGWAGFLVFYGIFFLLKAATLWTLHRHFYGIGMAFEGLGTVFTYPLIGGVCFYIYQKLG